MTTLREAAQMALDALEHGLPIIEDFGGKEQLQIQHKAIAVLYEALRAALAQQEREWQGLTDEERQERLYSDPIFGMAASTFARAIEAKLKEKNGL